MKTESMLATEKMLDVVKTLLDEELPENLFSKILRAITRCTSRTPSR